MASVCRRILHEKPSGFRNDSTLRSMPGTSFLTTRVAIVSLILSLHVVAWVILCLPQTRRHTHPPQQELKATIIDAPLQSPLLVTSASTVDVAPVPAPAKLEPRVEWGDDVPLRPHAFGQVLGGPREKVITTKVSSAADVIVRPRADPKLAMPALRDLLSAQGGLRAATGIVRVAAFVQPDGRVTDTTVEGSSGNEQLDEVALTYVQQWHFLPGGRNGTPEAMWVTCVVDFGALK